jgi:hydrogenase small subunit
MKITRREFVKYCSIAAGAIGLSSTNLMKLEHALAREGGINITWINGQSCTGCTVSFANSVYYSTIQELLLLTEDSTSIDLNYNETLMAAMGTQATQNTEITANPFILALEGSIPNADFCQIGNFSGASSENVRDVVTYLATHANCAAVLAIGTCASFGGIPAAAGNVTGAKGFLNFISTTQSTSVHRDIRRKTINIPGCPPNPNWIVGTIAYLIARDLAFPQLDGLRRPRTFFNERLCNYCPRFNHDYFVGISDYFRTHFDCPSVNEPERIGDPNQNTDSAGYCLKLAGCKGSRTKGDCSWRKWHSPGYGLAGINWCVGAGAPCQGCTQNYFPDKMSPFYYIR